jgi:hypothetical protein
MYLIDDVWDTIKSFLLFKHNKWLFNKVIKELPKPEIEPHLSTYRRINDDYAIVKSFEKVKYFKSYRFTSICFITKDSFPSTPPYQDELIWTDDITTI